MSGNDCISPDYRIIRAVKQLELNVTNTFMHRFTAA